MGILKIFLIRPEGENTIMLPATQGMIDREIERRIKFNRDYPQKKYAIHVGESLPSGELIDGEWRQKK